MFESVARPQKLLDTKAPRLKSRSGFANTQGLAATHALPRNIFSHPVGPCRTRHFMASIVPGLGPDSAGDGAAMADGQDIDAVRRDNNKRASFFIRTPP